MNSNTRLIILNSLLSNLEQQERERSLGKKDELEEAIEKATEKDIEAILTDTIRLTNDKKLFRRMSIESLLTEDLCLALNATLLAAWHNHVRSSARRDNARPTRLLLSRLTAIKPVLADADLI